MLINLRNALMTGKRKPTAKDYAGFQSSMFLFDGIENAGLGVHADTLPVAYGRSQWKNIAPTAATFAYNTDLDVVGMTPAADGMSFAADGATWAGWGYMINTAKISNADAVELLGTLFPSDDISVTVEVTITTSGTPTSRFVWLSGYNEHALYRYYNSNLNTLRYPRTNSTGGRQTATLGYSSLPASWSHCLSFTLSPSAEKLYIDGELVTSGTSASVFRFFNSMVALLRYNSVNSAADLSGKFHRVQITRGILTAAELAQNWQIDKARFPLT